MEKLEKSYQIIDSLMGIKLTLNIVFVFLLSFLFLHSCFVSPFSLPRPTLTIAFLYSIAYCLCENDWKIIEFVSTRSSVCRIMLICNKICALNMFLLLQIIVFIVINHFGFWGLSFVFGPSSESGIGNRG